MSTEETTTELAPGCSRTPAASSTLEVQSQDQLTRGLLIALILNVLATGSSFLGFFFSGSFSLLADAIHMLVDTFTYGVSYYTEMTRDGQKTTWCGYFAPIFSSVVFVGITIFIIVEAVESLRGDTHDVDATAMMIFSLIGICFDIMAFVGVLWGRKLCGIKMGHSHAAPCSGHGHSHGGTAAAETHNEDAGDQKELNVWSVVLHVIGDLFRSVALCVVSIVLFCGASSDTASKADAWTAIAICVVGLAFCLVVVVQTAIHYSQNKDKETIMKDVDLQDATTSGISNTVGCKHDECDKSGVK